MTPVVRVVRVIARLNVGGPSIQAITLTATLDGLGYRTTLVRGREGAREGNMDFLARDLGVSPVHLDSLRRDPGWRDLPALVRLVGLMWRQRPQIVHTHAAKAGTLGRAAALLVGLLGGERPVLVHTFHGHSLEGYFASLTARVYRSIERLLARRTDCLIAVSEEVRDDLVRLRVSPSEAFSVVPLGFDLARFGLHGPEHNAIRQRLRRELSVSPEATVVTLVARLVPIKRIDRFLRAAGRLGDLPDVAFLVVGDGELSEELRSSGDAAQLGDRLIWAGLRSDMPAVCAASDLVVLCSDNEGTPVSLIEASAAGLPVVCTDVGGSRKVVIDGQTGFLVPRDQEAELAKAMRTLVLDRPLRARMGRAGREHALKTFSLERLVHDIDGLYKRLLSERPQAAG